MLPVPKAFVVYLNEQNSRGKRKTMFTSSEESRPQTSNNSQPKNNLEKLTGQNMVALFPSQQQKIVEPERKFMEPLDFLEEFEDDD